MNSYRRRYRLISVVLGIGICFSLPLHMHGQDSSHTISGPKNMVANGPGTQDLDHIISPDDVLDVYIIDVAELSRQYRVSPSGMVSIPLLQKPLLAAGLSVGAFADTLSLNLKESGLVSDPHVSVTVVQSRIATVSVNGAVRQPQVFQIFGTTTLLDALSQAGGADDRAGGIAIIQRGSIAVQALRLNAQEPAAGQGATAVTQTVDLRTLLQGNTPDQNVVIYPGDRITVPAGGVVYVVGAVNRPGGFVLGGERQSLTVLKAVALAEDLKTTAVPKNSVIIRADAQAANGHRQIAVDLKKVLAGRTEDLALAPGDILFVPDSPGKRALRRGAEAALQVATGMAIYGIRP